MVWKNWFGLEELVWFGRIGLNLKNWFGLVELVWFGTNGLVWKYWFGLELVWFGLEELVWSRHLDMKSVSVEYQILKADERITTRDASEFD